MDRMINVPLPIKQEKYKMIVLYGKQFQAKLVKEKKKNSKRRKMLKEATESNL